MKNLDYLYPYYKYLKKEKKYLISDIFILLPNSLKNIKKNIFILE